MSRARSTGMQRKVFDRKVFNRKLVLITGGCAESAAPWRYAWPRLARGW